MRSLEVRNLKLLLQFLEKEYHRKLLLSRGLEIKWPEMALYMAENNRSFQIGMKNEIPVTIRE